MAQTSASAGDFDPVEFVQRYKRPLVATAAVVAIGGVGGWFYSTLQRNREASAERAYAAAEGAAYSGNAQVAERDLASVIDRYGNTPAGVRASMLLARSLFEQGKNTDAVDRLRQAADRGASKPYRSEILALIAGGLETQGNFTEAAAEYAKAAGLAATPGEREGYQADQARALMSGGKPDEALRIWQALAANESSPVASEARLRIGELTARPVKRG